MDKLDLDSDLMNKIINSMICRVNHVPFPETCNLNKLIIAEELRQQLIKIFEKIAQKYPHDLIPIIPELGVMICKLLTDTCPEVKIRLSEFLICLCNNEKLKKLIGVHSKGIVLSLCLNLKHSHNKIRKITIAVNDSSLNYRL